MFNILNIEIYTFIGGIGVKGSFEGLYTFLEVAEIYGIDDSCLRKQVARNKFVIGEEVKKMGRTWIITEQAMIKSFGALKFEEYKKKRQKKEHAKEKKLNGVHLNTGSNAQKISKGSGPKRNRSSKKVHSMNEKEEKIRDSWVNGEIKGVELKSFGALKFEEYKKKQQKKEQVKEEKLNGVYLNSGSNAQKISKVSGQKRKRSSKKVHSMNEKEEKIRDSWVNGDIKGVELKNFSFNKKDSE